MPLETLRGISGPSFGFQYSRQNCYSDAVDEKNRPPQMPSTDSTGVEIVSPRIHRVCVTCNNMFEVDPAHFESKHCHVCRRQ